MQNHLHMILKLENIKEYPKIIYSIKYYFSHRLNKNNKISESDVGWEKRKRFPPFTFHSAPSH